MEKPFDRLVQIMARLRSEGGCPWDREQTHESLKPYIVEEAYEVLETIDEGDMDGLKEELGDLLLQVVFHSRLAEEAGVFNVDDVLTAISDKLVRRHPHVFGESTADTTQKVLRQWDEIKKSEKPDNGGKSFLEKAAPAGLPALMRAMKVQEKASSVGFDWEGWSGAFDKVEEELKELRQAFTEGDKDKVEMELGDFLFSLVNTSRHLNVDPEEALRKTTGKFMRRFAHIEKRLMQTGRSPGDATLEEMDKLWDEAKKANV
jgi:tetrapyrrole methylase family protein/MazG family protein